MSTGLPGNQFVKDFHESFWDFGDQIIAAEGQTDATIIWQGLIDHARSNLALAHEQRTKMLFEFMQWVRAQGDIDGATKLHNKIVERLGLRDE